MKKILTAFIILEMLCIYFEFYKVKAENLEEGIILESTKQTVQKAEEFTITVKTRNLSIAACNITLYFDNSMLEPEITSENTNIVNDKILYTWYDRQGGQNINANTTLAEFKFRAKENGACIFTLEGDFYNENEQKITPNIQPVEVIIGEKTNLREADMQILEEVKSNDIDNTELAILRINKEGINPIFAPNIKEYYITTKEIEELEITAIAKNPNSNVAIVGNKNLKSGLNQISIKVISESGKNEAEYKIYATVTDDIEKANADLENLAIEGATLAPEFSEEITNYTLEVENNIENLNVLAIPQMQNAKVQIEGANNLKEGENSVEIIVTAENAQTFKKYNVKVKRMSLQETEEKSKQNNDSLKQISYEDFEIIDNSNEIEKSEEEKSEREARKSVWVIAGIIAVITVIGIIVIYLRKRTK